MIKFQADGRWYVWVGALGDIFSSEERNITQGQTRVINDELFYARYVYKNRVDWTQIGCSYDSVRTLKQKLLGVE
jgi:hypothetical protein